jgi:hypothetical protein
MHYIRANDKLVIPIGLHYKTIHLYREITPETSSLKTIYSQTKYRVYRKTISKIARQQHPDTLNQVCANIEYADLAYIYNI